MSDLAPVLARIRELVARHGSIRAAGRATAIRPDTLRDILAGKIRTCAPCTHRRLGLEPPSDPEARLDAVVARWRRRGETLNPWKIGREAGVHHDTTRRYLHRRRLVLTSDESTWPDITPEELERRVAEVRAEKQAASMNMEPCRIVRTSEIRWGRTMR